MVTVKLQRKKNYDRFCSFSPSWGKLTIYPHDEEYDDEENDDKEEDDDENDEDREQLS